MKNVANGAAVLNGLPPPFINLRLTGKKRSAGPQTVNFGPKPVADRGYKIAEGILDYVEKFGKLLHSDKEPSHFGLDWSELSPSTGQDQQRSASFFYQSLQKTMAMYDGTTPITTEVQNITKPIIKVKQCPVFNFNL